MSKLLPGDILGFSSHTLRGAVINMATYGIPFWGLSHVGIIADTHSLVLTGYMTHQRLLLRPYYLLFESTVASELQCAIQHKSVCGVQAHFPSDRIADYPGKVWHYPLNTTLRPLASARLASYLLRQIGKSYDQIGAFRAGGVGYSWLESKLRPENLESLFCSELCAAAHRHIGVFKTKHASKWSPNAFVRAERREGILGKPIRLK